MANDILTPTKVTREIMRVLHEKATAINSVNRQYDDSYAVKGAKIGDSLKIRLPNQYTVRTGKTINVQDTEESSVTATMATQKGVDMNFSSAELTLDLDDFSKRIIEPAVAVLVSNIEADFLQGATKKVYNLVGTAGTVPNALSIFGNARAMLNKYLAPKDGRRVLQLNSDTMSSMVDTLKGLFHDSTQVKRQYTEGYIGRTAGFDWMENERVYYHTMGADITGITLNTVTLANGDSTAAITGASSAPAVGSVFTFATGKAVHPETKTAYTHLQQFVVTAATTSSMSFSPAIYSSGPKQNVSVMPGTTSALTWIGAADTVHAQDLAFHPDFATFVSADLEDVSQYGAWGARENMDGLSIRLARQYDINNDNIPCRLDILYGYEVLRAQLACRVTS